MSDKVNLAEKPRSFAEHWSPRTVAQLNGHDVMVVKVKGKFVWHKHDDTDDFFLVLEGTLHIELRDGTITPGPGEVYVVPKGVEHRPVAREEAHVLLIEPTGTPNTGDPTTAAPRKLAWGRARRSRPWAASPTPLRGHALPRYVPRPANQPLVPKRGNAMASQLLPRSELAETLRAGLQRSSRTLLIAGIALVVLGSIAIIAPGLATLVVAKFIAWLLIVSAIAEFYLAFQVHGGWRIAGAVLTGLVSLVAGVWLLLNPLVGAAALTLLLAAYFVATGVVKAVAAFQLRPVRGWGWALASAIASIVLGLIVFSGWPGTALWVLGLMVGIDLLFYGWALLGLRAAVNR